MPIERDNRNVNDAIDEIVQEVNEALEDLEQPYKKYVALLTQEIAAPTAIVLENTLGGDIIWTRTGTGVYRGTLTGVFTENKTTVLCGSPYAAEFGVIDANWSNVNFISIYTAKIDTGAFVATDGFLNNTYIEIRVYN